MSYSLHRGAERDLLEATTFYRREGGTRLANRFLDAFARVADLRVAFPAIGTSTDDVRRMHPLQHFPYAVIHRQIGDHIRILVVSGHFRDPGFGESLRGGDCSHLRPSPPCPHPLLTAGRSKEGEGVKKKGGHVSSWKRP